MVRAHTVEEREGGAATASFGPGSRCRSPAGSQRGRHSRARATDTVESRYSWTDPIDVRVRSYVRNAVTAAATFSGCSSCGRCPAWSNTWSFAPLILAANALP